MASKELTDNERVVLARAVAYDRFLQQSHIDPMGEAFSHGWESALKFVEEERERRRQRHGLTGEDDQT